MSEYVYFVCVCKLGSEDLIKYMIIKGADVNASDNSEQTPLCACAKNGKSVDLS